MAWSEFFFNFRFSGRKCQSQQKLAKKITHFTTHLTLKIIFSRNTAETLFQFTNFPANVFLFGVGKNICRNSTVPFLDAQELHSCAICILHPFSPDSPLSHFANFSLSLPLCYSLNFTKKLQNERKEDFLHIWLLQRVKLYQRW